nr:hypothetical protein L203_01105 [Cryptococcus depauperatus CBS 7841]
MAEDINNLLYGITAEDLDDLDSFEDDNGPTQSQNQSKQNVLKKSIEFNQPQHLFAAAFSTGRGKSLPPPSTDALEKAKRFLDDNNDQQAIEVLPPPTKRSRLDEKPFNSIYPASYEEGISEQPAQNSSLFSLQKTIDSSPVSKSLSPSNLQPCLVPSDGFEVSFKTGRGTAVPLPSISARKRALALLADIDSAPEQTFDLEASSDSLKSSKLTETKSGFQTGRGAAVPLPSSAARQQALKLFHDIEHSSESQQFPMASSPEPRFSQSHVSSGSDKNALPRISSVARVMSLFEDVDSASPSRPHTIRMIPLQPSTPSRLPLSTTTNTYSNKGKSVSIKTPSGSARRIGLGATPTVKKSKRGFITPFRTTTAKPREIDTTPKPPQKTFTSVFDLSISFRRNSLKESHLHPQYNTHQELVELGIPLEICFIHPKNAIFHHFILDDGSCFGTEQALKLLQKDGCDTITQKWVNCHWSQILWKLAGEVQAKPAIYIEKWNWNEVINQLKYRYERECGVAQRSLIKRIQEHDSSPSLPMVLVVNDIHCAENEDEGEGDKSKQIIYLVLTDGWYPIRAQIDECLSRAVKKGKISIGRKLAITGAKLESENDGTDVLDAFDSSRLVLSGNSTSLAKWDSRLGMQPRPFIASLSSLSVDGGIVTLMDIIIDRVYPLAYTNGDKNSKEPPWDQKEETEREEQWKEHYIGEQMRLQEQLTKQMDKLHDVVSVLTQYALEINCVNYDEPDDIESDLDDLLDAKDMIARAKTLQSNKVGYVARCAEFRLKREIEEGRVEIENELQTLCPPRNVRCFRLVRFRDAQQGSRGTFRCGMLNIWEAQKLGKDLLQQGQRYLVSGYKTTDNIIQHGNIPHDR